MKRLVFQTWTTLNGTEPPHVEHSSRAFQLYAEQHDADYELLRTNETRNFSHPFFNKYWAIERLDTYDQVLYADSDVLPKPDAENIFQTYAHSGWVGLCSNIADQAEYGFEDTRSMGPFNAGVLLFNNHAPYQTALLKDITIAAQLRPGLECPLPYMQRYLGKWWQYWDDEHSDELTLCSDGVTPNDEPLFWRILYLYSIRPFHIQRRFNYRVGRSRAHGRQAQFLHFLQDRKTELSKLYTQWYPGL